MAGVLPFEVEVSAKPQGHGYTELCVDAPNPFFPQGLTLKGHEFHYLGSSPELTCPRPPARFGVALVATRVATA